MTIEEAIRDIEECVIPYVGGMSLRMAVEALKEQRPHGEWIEHRQFSTVGYFYSEYECSNCHDEVWQKTEWQFCPNCGADMRKEGD